MIVRLSLNGLKDDDHFRVERRDGSGVKIAPGIEDQTVLARRETFGIRE
jgi:hypothetical protein